MEDIRKYLKELTKTDVHLYSDIATVETVYDRETQSELGMTYDKNKHTLCDVRLVKDGSIVFGVKMTPIVLKEDDVIRDENTDGNVWFPTPSVGSYVFISYLDAENAFLSLLTNTNSFKVGSSEGAYIDFYIKDKIRTIDLKNADEFRVEFKDNKVFSIKNDAVTNLTDLFISLDKIHFSILSGASIRMENKEVFVSVEDGGKIDITDGTIHIKDILVSINDELLNYLNSVNAGLVIAGYPATTIPNAVVKLNEIKTRINKLFK